MGMYYEIHWYAGKLSLPRFISNIPVHETMVDVGNDVQSPPVASHMEKKPKPAGNICPFHDSNCQRVFIQFMLLCLTFPSCSHSNSLRIAIFQGYLPMKHEDGFVSCKIIQIPLIVMVFSLFEVPFKSHDHSHPLRCPHFLCSRLLAIANPPSPWEGFWFCLG